MCVHVCGCSCSLCLKFCLEINLINNMLKCSITTIHLLVKLSRIED